ncbi:hypothetical protein GGR42_002211 [Saonia flava]|uniref:Uncharacterized protein n=1 Tax=Saonia flava TaxID=523696 RepID=A0A846R4M1_9FLAO|nr:hypothetical protein [Saonia flava]NJB71749.1 hypothetical protein [Saonia flava]
MIKYLVILMTSICANLGSSCDDMELCRETYHKITSEQDLLDFLNVFEEADCYLAKPYKASAIMHKAAFTIFPHKKMRYFKLGKNQLEEFIKNNPSDIEGRYVRVMTQANIPSILGYKDHMEGDVLFIKNNIKHSNLPDNYKELILKNIAEIKF